ncbi:MAG: tetratricopeptide repeat protein [Cyanobacteria bacterium P01_F01_bin.150]
MNNSVQTLSLLTSGALMLLVFQSANASAEVRNYDVVGRSQNQPIRDLQEKKHKPVFSQAVMEKPAAGSTLKQTQLMAEATEPLLEVEGVLEAGDSIFSDDNGFYDTYTFEAEAGQAVIITLESEEFDTYLLFRDSQGEGIAQNDDISSESRNSQIAVVLSETGTYQVLAGAYDDTQMGAYRLTVMPTQPDAIVVQEFEAKELNRQGIQLLNSARYQEALELFEQSLAIRQAIDDRRGEAESLNRIGLVYDNLSQYQEALDYYERALAIHNELVDRSNEAVSLNNIGGIYSSLGQYHEALSYYERSVAIRDELGDRNGQAIPLNNIGFIYGSQGQYQQALDYFERAQEIHMEVGDRSGEASSLNNIGSIYSNQGQYQEALSYYEQALAIRVELGDRRDEAESLNNIGFIYASQGQYQEALESFEQSLAIRTEISDRNGEAISLNNIGSIYDNQGQYQEALNYYEQALTIVTEIGDRNGEANSLNNIGGIYHNQSQYQEALRYYEQSLAISAEIGNRDGEARVLNNIGSIYDNLGKYHEALSYYEQSLAILIDIGNRSGEATSLNNIGFIYSRQGQYQEALSYYERAFTILSEIGKRSSAATALGNIGSIYHSQGQYQEALAYHERSLDIFTEVGSLSGKSRALNNIGFVYDSQGQYQEALSYYERSLAILTETGDRNGQAITVSNIAGVYDSQGQYQEALNYYERGLAIDIETGDRQGEATSLNNIGSIYDNLGQYQQSLSYYERALAIRTEIGDRSGEASTLNNLGFFYTQEGEYQKALSYYERALAISIEIGDRNGEARLLNNLGGFYDKQEKYQTARRYYEQALNIYVEIGDRSGEANSLNNIGSVYANQDQHQKALDYYQRALAIHNESGKRECEATALNNIGHSLEAQNQPELAILFYKRAVSVYESIRGGLHSLNAELQASYTDTIADTYRKLADLLLQEDRILEAQRILDLLKVQELDESLHDVQRNSDTETEVVFWQIEEELLALYEQVITESSELIELQAQDYNSLSPGEQQRRNELQQRYTTVQNQFIAFLDRPEVQALLAQIEDETDRQNVDIERQYRSLQNELKTLPQSTALLYPLILSDRLELLLITADGPPLRYPIDIKEADLNRKIVSFGQALKSPSSNIQPLAQELYSILFAKLEETLDQAGIESIIYAPDGALRYVPLAALHDGKQYLANRFSISHITAVSLTNFADSPDTGNRRLLAAACAECSFTVPVGDREFSFSDLPYTEAEVRFLADQFSDTTVLLNQDFNRQQLENGLNRSILHLATHGAVVENNPAQSFVVLGTGETVSLETIRYNWKLNAELVVLSACETAVGSEELGSGVEILGLGYQIQETGAQAVLASLWKVSDSGTQTLMNAFYTALNNGHSKAEALQRAQQALITSDESVLVGERGETNPAGLQIIDIHTGQPLSQSSNLSHPYYWAPFILIGNGL